MLMFNDKWRKLFYFVSNTIHSSGTIIENTIKIAGKQGALVKRFVSYIF